MRRYVPSPEAAIWRHSWALQLRRRIVEECLGLSSVRGIVAVPVIGRAELLL